MNPDIMIRIIENAHNYEIGCIKLNSNSSSCYKCDLYKLLKNNNLKHIDFCNNDRPLSEKKANTINILKTISRKQKLAKLLS